MIQDLNIDELEISTIKKNFGDENDIKVEDKNKFNDNYDVNVILYRPKKLSH